MFVITSVLRASDSSRAGSTWSCQWPISSFVYFTRTARGGADCRQMKVEVKSARCRQADDSFGREQYIGAGRPAVYAAECSYTGDPQAYKKMSDAVRNVMVSAGKTRRRAPAAAVACSCTGAPQSRPLRCYSRRGRRLPSTPAASCASPAPHSCTRGLCSGHRVHVRLLGKRFSRMVWSGGASMQSTSIVSCTQPQQRRSQRVKGHTRHPSSPLQRP